MLAKVPEFAEFILQTPEDARTGRAFELTPKRQRGNG